MEPATISGTASPRKSRSKRGFITTGAPTEPKVRSINTLDVIAGFTMFLPIPPKRHLTTTIANTEPITASQILTFVLRLRARRRPVTTAERSPIVCFLPTARLKRNSARTAVATQVRVIQRALRPKMMIPAIVAGSIAITTSSIMLRVEAPFS